MSDALYIVEAIALVLHIGCRPAEAAYIVFNRSIEKNDYVIKHAKFKERATAPKTVTKTKHDYFFLLPSELSPFVGAIKKHMQNGFTRYEMLTTSLAHYFTRKVVKMSKVPFNPCTNRPFCLRTIRAMRASEYIKLYYEYVAMDWKPMPPNPLMHEDIQMTLDRYAIKGTNNIYEARKRCIAKYKGHPELHQPWMIE